MKKSDDEGWRFLYWDDPGDSQDSVDNQKPKEDGESD